jgi:adenylyl- and sulfurtransferase ThiI
LSKNLADAFGIRRLSEVEVCEKRPYLEQKEKISAKKVATGRGNNHEIKARKYKMTSQTYSGENASFDMSVKNSFDNPP